MDELCRRHTGEPRKFFNTFRQQTRAKKFYEKSRRRFSRVYFGVRGAVAIIFR
jgi:hypothetical protein